MSADQGSYKAFRARLDDVLRQKNPDALRAFLITEGQWQASDTTDTEAALWMMIATSPALRSMHDEAERWLLTHGHETEASAIFGGRHKSPGGAPRQTSGGGRRGAPPPQRPKRPPPTRRS
ncbi:MAG TPA: hypothetical protein VKQ30_08445 [Ktedonobacterales bacterium]|nr:hypothetical protein [Ktedonobacterales bacterium]